MFDKINENKVSITDIATATAAIMTSDIAGEWVTIEVNAGDMRTGSKFVTIRTGQVITTTAFGDKDIDQCKTVKMTYFAGDKIETVYIKSSLKKVNELLGISHKVLLKEKEKPTSFYSANGELIHKN